MANIILASTSPRRKTLLEQISIPFSVHPAHTDETIAEETLPEQAVQELALRKAAAVFKRFPDAAVIGADTVVAINGRILGKPETAEEAAQMLNLLSGKVHSVYTGTAILFQDKQVVFWEKTDVEFWELSENEISAYIQTGEPFDKAGSYGIQSAGALFVKKIHGDYFNVVGLPIAALYRKLKHLGLASGPFHLK